MDIAARVKKVIAEQLGENVADLKDETRLIEDLDADSLDQVEVVMAIEDEFETEIPDDAANKMLTVGDVITWVTKDAEQKARRW